MIEWLQDRLNVRKRVRRVQWHHHHHTLSTSRLIRHSCNLEQSSTDWNVSPERCDTPHKIRFSIDRSREQQRTTDVHDRRTIDLVEEIARRRIGVIDRGLIDERLHGRQQRHHRWSARHDSYCHSDERNIEAVEGRSPCARCWCVLVCVGVVVRGSVGKDTRGKSKIDKIPSVRALVSSSIALPYFLLFRFGTLASFFRSLVSFTPLSADPPINRSTRTEREAEDVRVVRLQVQRTAY